MIPVITAVLAVALLSIGSCGRSQSVANPTVYPDDTVRPELVKEGQIYETNKRLCIGIEQRKYCFPSEFVVAAGRKTDQGTAGVVFELPMEPETGPCSAKFQRTRSMSFFGYTGTDDFHFSKKASLSQLESHFKNRTFRRSLPSFGSLDCSSHGNTRFGFSDGFMCRLSKHKFSFSGAEYLACSNRKSICMHHSIGQRGALKTHLRWNCLHKADATLNFTRELLDKSELK